MKNAIKQIAGYCLYIYGMRLHVKAGEAAATADHFEKESGRLSSMGHRAMTEAMSILGWSIYRRPEDEDDLLEDDEAPEDPLH